MRKLMAQSLLAAIISMAAWAGAAAQQIQISPTNRTIEVVATDSAERRADAAVVHIGYQIYGPTSAAVYTHAAGLSQAVAEALDQLGIAKVAIESSTQSTGPVQDYTNNGLPPAEAAQRRFQAEQSWLVHAAPDAVAKVLAAAVSAGANQSGDVDWSVADPSVFSAEAAANALKHARAIAEQMAAGLGAKLGPLVYASNQAEQQPSPFAVGRPIRVSNAAPAKAAPQLSILPPLQRSSATVRAVFSLQ